MSAIAIGSTGRLHHVNRPHTQAQCNQRYAGSRPAISRLPAAKTAAFVLLFTTFPILVFPGPTAPQKLGCDQQPCHIKEYRNKIKDCKAEKGRRLFILR